MSTEISKTQLLHTIPLRDLVIFPHAINTLIVGRKKSINTAIEAKKRNIPILAINQIHSDSDEFSLKALNKVGTISTIIEHKKMADGTLKIVLAGIRRVKLVDIAESKDVFLAKTTPFPQEVSTFETDKTKSLFKSCIMTFEEYIKRTKIIPLDILSSIVARKTEFELTNIIASLVGNNPELRQKILETEAIEFFIFGHRHLPLEIKLSDSSKYINLGDWISYYSYAVFDGYNVELKYFKDKD